jgi:hypothetical protein
MNKLLQKSSINRCYCLPEKWGIMRYASLLVGLIFLLSTSIASAQVTPAGATSDAACGADCWDLFSWSPVADGTGTNIPNIGEGEANDANCNTVIGGGIEYTGNDTNADVTGTAFGANSQGTSPWVDDWIVTFGTPLTSPIFNFAGLLNTSEVSITDCNGAPISVTDISTGTVIASGVFTGNDRVQLTGTYDCVNFTISNDRSDAYTVNVGTCLGADPLPPCVDCGPNEDYEYVRLVNRQGTGTGATADVELNNILVGTAEVLFSNLSINEDLSGPAFGAFANGVTEDETLLLQIDFCEPITVQQLDILGLETESQAWVGTTLSGSGATGIPQGITLTQCGGANTMMPTGNMVTNTSASCANQGNGNYTTGGLTTSSLFFRYTNPVGGCRFDKATFRIGTCVPDGSDAIPVCPIEYLTYATDIVDYVTNGPDFVGNDANAFQIMRDGNGNYFDMTCTQIANDVMDIDGNMDGDLDDPEDVDANGNGVLDAGNAIATTVISPCAELVDIEECSFCNPPPPCDACTAGSFELIDLDATGTNAAGLPTGIIEVEGVCIGQYEFEFSDLDVNLDGNGTRFGGFDNDGGTMLLRLDFCDGIDIQQLDITNLEVESQVSVGTSVSGAGASAVLSGLNLTFCEGSDRMDQDDITNGNTVTTAGPGCGANPNASYTVGGATVNSVYFKYTNPMGGCSYDYVGFSLGICYEQSMPAIPVCPVQEYQIACYDLADNQGPIRNVLIDAAGNVFDGQSCSANIPAADGSGNVDLEVAITNAVALETIDIGCAEIVGFVEPECDFASCVPESICTTCGPAETFDHISLDETGTTAGGLGEGTVSLDGTKIGTYEFVFSDLDVSTDGRGTTFGGFDNDGGTMLLRMDFCSPLTIGELDVINLEVESQVSIGTAASTNDASAVLSGLGLTFCDGSSRMDQNDITNGNLITTAGPGCGANPNATYQVSPAAVSTLFFKYQNPTGGCSRDYVGFRIGACSGDLAMAVPTCPLNLVEVDECPTDPTSTNFNLLVDANGNYFDLACPADLPTMAVQTVALSACATTTLVEECDVCFTCPTIAGPIALPLDGPICAGSSFDVSVSGLDTMSMDENNGADFGIEFVYFNGATAPANAYAGGTSLGAVPFAGLTSNETVATLQGATIPMGSTTPPGMTYTICAILTPDPATAPGVMEPTCQPQVCQTINILDCQPEIAAAKSISSFAPSASGVAGNVDVTFQVEVCNTGNVNLSGVSLTDNVATQLGSAFVGILSQPTISSSSALTDPTTSATFDGAGMDSLLTGGGLLQIGECVTVDFAVEVDPNAPGAPDPLQNSAMAAAKGATNSGAPLMGPGNMMLFVTDLSDAGTDPNGTNPNFPGDTGGSDDPLALNLPSISAAKSIVGIDFASSGTTGNFNVTFDMVVENTGNVDLTNLTLIDDLATEFGTSFVNVVTAPQIVASTATTNPATNAGYSGMGANTDLLSGGGTLEPGQQFTVRVEIELSSSTALETASNQATAGGDAEGPNGTTITVTDNSDSGLDPESNNPNGIGDTGGSNDATPLGDCFTRVSQGITCNPDIQVSIDNSCNAAIDPSMLLEGEEADCFGSNLPLGGFYRIEVRTSNGQLLADLDPATTDILELDLSAHVGRTLRFKVIEVVTGNSCWGDMSIEDKLAPQLVCPSGPIMVTCLDDLDCVAQPTATDGCGNATINLTNEVYISTDVCSGIELVRTYIAVDEDGNISDPCSVTIIINQAPVTFPRDIEWTCAQYACYPSITDATDRSTGILDTQDDNGDSITSNLDDDDDDSTTAYSQDDDPITVGLVCNADDGFCAPFGERDGATGGQCGLPTYNLTVSAGGAGISCLQPIVNGLEDDDILETTGSGVPNVYSTTSGFCKYHVTFEDDTLETCNAAPGVFKILRSWRALNWCDNSILTDLQVIKVLDRTNPGVSVPALIELTANTSGTGAHGLCGSSGLLPLPVLSDNCSGVDLSSVTVNTPAGQATPLVLGGQVVGYQIPAPYLALGGPYTVSYTAADNCGNITTVTTQVVVEDNTPPVAICDEITNLSLTGTAASAIFADRLDDGSYDNCNDVWFKVIRMDELNAGDGATRGVALGCDRANSNDPAETSTGSLFDNEAFFCCEDIATNNNMVVVRVYDVDPGAGAVSNVRQSPGGDLFGHYNDCMVEVEVEDKVAPIKLIDSPDRTISCTDATLRQQYLDDTNLTFDAPIFQDNCDFTVSLQIIDGTTTCGDGVIRRRFQATDENGNASILCEQRITSLLEHDYSILWPRDEDRNMCTAGVLGDTLSRPNSLIEDACDLLAVSYVDQRFATNDDACYKILRTYDVINWCEWDGVSAAVQVGNPTFTTQGPRLDVVVSTAGAQDVQINFSPSSLVSVGRWGYIQQIKVYDEEDPELGTITQAPCEAANVVADVNGLGCGQSVSVDFELTDNCGGLTPPTYRLVAFTGDADGDGQISAAELAAGTSFTNDPFGGSLVAPAGSTSSVAQSGTFTITGTYPLGDHVFVVSATDLCGNAAEYYVPFTAEDCKEPTPYAISFITIDLMATGMVDVWASDVDNGSFDDCGAVKLSFSANVADSGRTYTCADLGTNPAQLWVTDASGNQDFVDIDIIIQDNLGACGTTTQPRIAASLTTAGGMGVQGAAVNVSGGATMSATTNVSGVTGFDVNAGGDYTVSALLDSDPANGVTTYDLYLIGQHILGVTDLTTFSELTAADANANGSVTAFDMTVIRRVILGLDQNFRGNTSWRFFDANDNASEVVNFNDVQGQVAADFLSVKTGDVNGTAQANSRQALAPRTLVGEFALVANDAVLGAGETQVVSFNASEVALGYQLTLEWDATALEVVGVNGGAHNAADFGKHLLSAGKLTMSHNGSMEGELFSLEVRALRDGVALSEVMSAGNSVTVAEAYGVEGTKSVAVRFGGSVAGAGNALEQNRPNPFAGTTQIGFTLAEAGSATLTVTDVTGKVVWRTAGQFDAGRSQVDIAAGDLPSAGLLNYTLTAGDFTATRKMVVIK